MKTNQKHTQNFKILQTDFRKIHKKLQAISVNNLLVIYSLAKPCEKVYKKISQKKKILCTIVKRQPINQIAPSASKYSKCSKYSIDLDVAWLAGSRCWNDTSQNIDKESLQHFFERSIKILRFLEIFEYRVKTETFFIIRVASKIPSNRSRYDKKTANASNA